MKTILRDKDPTENYAIEFDFSKHVLTVASAETVCRTIVDAPRVVTPVYRFGIGHTLVTGAPSADTTNIAATTPTFSNGVVKQVVTGGINGNTYELTCTVTAAEGTFVLTCIQPVRVL